jgi:hypothetical protein
MTKTFEEALGNFKSAAEAMRKNSERMYEAAARDRQRRADEKLIDDIRGAIELKLLYEADARRANGKPIGELETLAGTVDRIPEHMCEDLATIWGLQHGPGGWDAHVEKIGEQDQAYGSARQCLRSFLEFVRGKDERD